MSDYAEYDDLSDEARDGELADLRARVAALSGVEGSAPDEPSPPPVVAPGGAPAFDHQAHAADVEFMASAPFETADDFWAAAAQRGLTNEDQPTPPAAPSAEAMARCLEPGLSEQEFWERANAAGVVAGNQWGQMNQPAT